ncbi:hypothetical protein J5N97_007171 [Dioscorea zingiberensis]|uniref:Uncharacterized protein n=1 Tax=Dioscorea zingiberensis TaxID=325984 RepID=A0A9D5HTD2_9LILI|nr:hypothetical protein J5N97_007171 [Dioscorea zingiberensis]
MPYEIELDPEVPVSILRPTSYVVTIDDAKTLHVTVTSDVDHIQEWLNMAINSYQGGHFVSIHAEPRPFKSKLVHKSFQPTIRTFFVAIGPRVLVIHLRHSYHMPWMSVDNISRLNNGDFYFVGMDMTRISWWLYKRGCSPKYHEDVRKLAADQTLRVELRTAGLKKIVQAVTGLAMDPWLSRRLKGWSLDSLSPKLVMQGSIRAFMAFEVAQAWYVVLDSS